MQTAQTNFVMSMYANTRKRYEANVARMLNEIARTNPESLPPDDPRHPQNAAPAAPPTPPAAPAHPTPPAPPPPQSAEAPTPPSDSALQTITTNHEQRTTNPVGQSTRLEGRSPESQEQTSGSAGDCAAVEPLTTDNAVFFQKCDSLPAYSSHLQTAYVNCRNMSTATEPLGTKPVNENVLGTSRRSFLQYVGFAAAAATGTSILGPLGRSANAAGLNASAAAHSAGGFSLPSGLPDFYPVAYPLPLPGDIAQDAGKPAVPDAGRLARFTVVDDLVLPKGYEYKIIAAWGDRFGPASAQFVFGYNCDFTGLQPISGKADEFYLLVNHEYISARPWLQGLGAAHGRTPLSDTASGTMPDGTKLIGLEINLLNPPADKAGLARDLRDLCHMAMDDLGVSVLHVKREASGHFVAIKDSPLAFRISAHRGVNVLATSRFEFSGPAAGLLGKPVGTFSNCSGGVTPWGTFLTCEENFQDQVNEFTTPSGQTLASTPKLFTGNDVPSENPAAAGLPFEFDGLGTGCMPPLDGRQYGWVVEIDPVTRSMIKHTGMGRFRHENVAVRADVGKRVAAYMGDDRRGGHVWKFISEMAYTNAEEGAAASVRANSESNKNLLARGTLCVARFEKDFTGRWVPLVPSAKLVRPDPARCATGHVWLPSRKPDENGLVGGHDVGGHVAVGVEGGKQTQLTVQQWVESVEAFAGKAFDACVLGDLYKAESPELLQGLICMDAFAAANAIGGTPTARPEDIEVHPGDQSVYVAFTDSTGSGDGSPDVEIFPDSRGRNSRQYGAIYRLQEQDNVPDALAFTWGKFVSSGEVAEGGGGFACADNLVFDPGGHLWMVCDITTTRHNFPVTRMAEDKTAPGAGGFVGIFGNNAMFFIPTSGPRAGLPHCFATGPMDCELCGPTFTADGKTLVLSVQHPGELGGRRDAGTKPVQRTMRIADRTGKVFEQARTVPLGSAFAPDGEGTPRPAVVSIARKA